MPRSLLIIDFSLSWRLSISKDSAVGFRQNFHLQYKTLTNKLKMSVCPRPILFFQLFVTSTLNLESVLLGIRISAVYLNEQF